MAPGSCRTQWPGPPLPRAPRGAAGQILDGTSGGRLVRRPRGDSQLVALRSAPGGCYSPLDPFRSPVVGHSFGVSDDPGGIRSSSGSASLRRAATPPLDPPGRRPAAAVRAAR